jgi:BolA protein
MVVEAGADKALQRRFREEPMTVADRIRAKLTEAFHPVAVNVVDESHLHKGHAGHRPEGETHFRINIIAESFRGKTRVEAHRMIYEAVKTEIAEGLHALAIDAKAPG